MQHYTQSYPVQCDWADRDPFFALAPTFCSQLNRTYFSPVGLWCIAQLYFIMLVHELQEQGTQLEI